MRWPGCAFVMLSPLICASHVTFAQSGWYIEGSAGAYFRSDRSSTSTFTNDDTSQTATGTSTMTFDPGVIVDLGAGYRLPLRFRVEGELGFAYYNTATTSPFTTATNIFPYLNGTRLNVQSRGDHERYLQTLNAFYDLPLSGPFVPYLGLGFGADEDSGSTIEFTELDGVRTSPLHSATSIHPVVLTEIGLTIQISNRWSIVPAYRFQHVFQSNGAPDESANIFKLGLRYSF